MTPLSFDSNALTNYEVLFDPTTVFDGMYLKIEFPDQTILTNETACEHVVCIRDGQSLIVQHVESFNVTNIINPAAKIITDPFELSSYTNDHDLVEVLNGFRLNFKCALPCKTCLGDSNRVCASCEPTGKYLLYSGMCYS